MVLSFPLKSRGAPAPPPKGFYIYGDVGNSLFTQNFFLFLFRTWNLKKIPAFRVLFSCHYLPIRHGEDHAHGSVLLPRGAQLQKKSALQRLHVGHPQKWVTLIFYPPPHPHSLSDDPIFISLFVLKTPRKSSTIMHSGEITSSFRINWRCRCAVRCAVCLCAALKGSIRGNKACQNEGWGTCSPMTPYRRLPWK